MSAPASRLRLILLLVALGAGLAGWPRGAAVRAAAPTLAVNPTTVLPHGVIAVSGTGYDPSTSGKQVTVDISVISGGAPVHIGSLPTDPSGNISSSSQPLTLPFSMGAGPATIVASEPSNTSISASVQVTVTALQPQINGGQPITAHLGDQIEIKGNGFAPDDSVTVSLGGQQLNTSAGGNSATADASGAIDITLAVPQTATPGGFKLLVTGSVTGPGQQDAASVPITLVAASSTPAPGTTGTPSPGTPQPGAPTLILSPNPAAVGTTVRGTADGFQPNEPVSFTLKYFDLGINSYAQQNSPATADASGHAVALISIPGSADGNQPASVTARGINSGISVSTPLGFAVLASLSFTPPTALAGARILVGGAGFVPGENLFVTTRLFKPPIGAFARVDATGHFTATVQLDAGLQPGAALVLAVSGSGGDDASNTFTVAQPVPPAEQVAPKTAQAGTAVTVTGQGYGPDEGLTFSVDKIVLAAVPATAVTDALGAFTATVTLTTTLAPGLHDLQVQGASSGTTLTAPIPVSLPQSNHWYFAEGFTGQGPRVFFHETISLLNTGDKATAGTLTYMFPDGSTESLPITVAARSVQVEDVNNDLGPDRIASALVQTDQPIYAERTILRTDARKHTLDTDYSPGQSAPLPTWYFAEGYSGNSFQPYLTVQNPFASPVTMTVTLYPTDAAPRIIPAALPGYGRYTLNLRGALPNKSFSIKVAAGSPVVAERVEYWGDGVGSGKFGAGVKPGVGSTAATWYFGYASILGGDQAFISVLNPNTTPAGIRVAFYDGTGTRAGTATVTVAPGRRATLSLNKLLPKERHSPVAAILTASQGVVAEENQYFGGSPNAGTHPGVSIEGRTTLAGRWSFAAGNTGAYQEAEYILNPAGKPAVVQARFYGRGGQPVTVSYPVGPGRVISVAANAVPGLQAGPHGSVWTVTSGPPVVVVQLLRGKDGRSALGDQGVPG